MASEWLSLDELAATAGVTPRALRKVVKQSKSRGVCLWRGAELTYREAKIATGGGRSGLSYQVLANSLPIELQLSLKDHQRPVERRLKHGTKAQWEREFWDRVLGPILNFPAHSKERGAAIIEAASLDYLGSDGELIKFTARTIRRKLASLEASGYAHLSRHKRRDAGKKLVFVTREVDSASKSAGIDEKQLAQFAMNFQRYVRSLVAQGVPRKLVTILAEGELNKQSLALGISQPKTPFRIPANFIQAERVYRRVERFRQDRKADEDAKPRVKRNREGMLPMDVVFADVHPVDILVCRDDGSTATARLIGWLDVATNRMFTSLYLCQKGEGIRNSHVIQSFIDMMTEWGAPRHLYLDNGSEYNWAEFIDDALKLIDERGNPLIGDVGRNSRVIRAKAYNASAKPIEGIFRVLEYQFFKVIPGWIGGDRMRQKSANVGKAPMPFPGSFEELKARIQAMIGLYNESPQRGSLKGLSPHGSFRMAIAAGWAMTEVSTDTFQLAFSEEKTRTVRQGVIEYAGERWTCRELQAYQGDKVIVLTPKYERSNGLPLKNERGEIFAVAHRERTYGVLDTEGAKEAARRSRAHREGIAALERNVGKIDIQNEIDSNIIHLPKPPRAPVGATLAPSDMARHLIANINEPAEERQEREGRERQEAASKQLKLMNKFLAKSGRVK